MKYIRTKDGRIIDLTSKQVSSYEIVDDKTAVDEYGEESGFICVYYYDEDIGEHIEYDGKGGRSMDNWYLKDIVKQADTIEDLIQIGDIVFYWQQSDDKEHCSLMVYDSDITTMKFNAITKLLIPVGDDYKCVAKGYPTFSVIRDRRYLVNKGELELL